MARLRSWQPSSWKSEGAIRKKSYECYDDYVRHQKHGLEVKGGAIMRRFDTDVKRFKSNFNELWFLSPDIGKMFSPMTCLCIGARSGAEVQALKDLGHDAIGIDVAPGNEELVLYGDMHKIPFGQSKFDVVYSNIFDHVYDLEKALSEVKRVMKDRGVFILEAVVGYEEGGWPGDHESAYWATTEDFFKSVLDHGFKFVIDIKPGEEWGGNISNVKNVKGLGFKRALLKKGDNNNKKEDNNNDEDIHRL